MYAGIEVGGPSGPSQVNMLMEDAKAQREVTVDLPNQKVTWAFAGDTVILAVNVLAVNVLVVNVWLLIVP